MMLYNPQSIFKRQYFKCITNHISMHVQKDPIASLQCSRPIRITESIVTVAMATNHMTSPRVNLYVMAIACSFCKNAQNLQQLSQSGGELLSRKSSSSATFQPLLVYVHMYTGQLAPCHMAGSLCMCFSLCFKLQQVLIKNLLIHH